MEKESKNLKLVKADLLDYDSLVSAIDGCSGVFHVASPVPSTIVPNPEAGNLFTSRLHRVFESLVPLVRIFHFSFSRTPSVQVELLEPAVKGTLNVLKACLEAKVERVVYVSSSAAVALNPSWPKDRVMDETCWSDKEYCRTTKVN